MTLAALTAGLAQWKTRCDRCVKMNRTFMEGGARAVARNLAALERQ
jgi:hypothetical protein